MLSVFFFCAARKANVRNGSKAVAATLGGKLTLGIGVEVRLGISRPLAISRASLRHEICPRYRKPDQQGRSDQEEPPERRVDRIGFHEKAGDRHCDGEQNDTRSARSGKRPISIVKAPGHRCHLARGQSVKCDHDRNTNYDREQRVHGPELCKRVVIEQPPSTSAKCQLWVESCPLR